MHWCVSYSWSLSLPVFSSTGVNSQLWYVNNGTVNHYALSYEIVVPPQLDALTFYWQALQGRTVRDITMLVLLCLKAICITSLLSPFFHLLNNCIGVCVCALSILTTSQLFRSLTPCQSVLPILRQCCSQCAILVTMAWCPPSCPPGPCVSPALGSSPQRYVLLCWGSNWVSK